MDGLLIDSEPFWRKAEIEVFSTVGLCLTEEMCLQTMGLRMDVATLYWYERFPWTGKSVGQVEAEVVARVTELIRDQAEALAGVEATISFFEQHSVPVAVCSSSAYTIIEAALGKLGLRERIGIVHSAEEEPYGKPHPGAYLTTAEKLGIPPHQCLAFEDSLNGMIAGKAARMKVVAVPGPGLVADTRYDFCDAKLGTLEAFDDALFARLQ